MAVKFSYSLMLGACLVVGDGHHPARASDTGAYAPDVVEFAGGNAYVFPADDAFDLSAGGTIEFWVAADWTEDPGFAPVLLANTGPEGSSYLIAISGVRDALVVNAHDAFHGVPFDFSDGRLHHVALASSGETTFVMIDGEVRAALDLTFANLPSAGLFVGAATEADAPFTGAIAQLRLWSVALEPLTILDYLQRDIDDPQAPHPDLEFLIAESDFRNAALQIAVEFASPDGE